MTTSRRDFIKIMGGAAGAVGAAAAGLSASEASAAPVSSVERGTVTEPKLSITGIPKEVSITNVDMAKKPAFENTIGSGTEMCVASPGVLLFGPDMDPVEARRLLKARKGYYFGPLNQIPLTACTSEHLPQSTAISLDEGSHVVLTGAKLKLTVGEIKISVDGDPTNNWMIIIKATFADGEVDSDLNKTVFVDDFVPGHAQAMRMPPGAFIDEEFFLANAEASHTGLGGVTGNEGASKLNVLMVDTNTGAVVWVENIQKQGQPAGPWTTKGTNIKR